MIKPFDQGGDCWIDIWFDQEEESLDDLLPANWNLIGGQFPNTMVWSQLPRAYK
jgi:hypothetical protein